VETNPRYLAWYWGKPELTCHNLVGINGRQNSAQNCETKRSWLETVFSPWSEILQNSSCVCVAVHEILTALELALREEEIQEHVRSTQYQFRVFKNVDCFMSLRKCYLDKAVTLLFCDSIIQGKCRLLPVPKHPHLRRAVTACDILSALMLITCSAKGLSWQPNRPPRCAPGCIWQTRYGWVRMRKTCCVVVNVF